MFQDFNILRKKLMYINILYQWIINIYHIISFIQVILMKLQDYYQLKIKETKHFYIYYKVKIKYIVKLILICINKYINQIIINI